MTDPYAPWLVAVLVFFATNPFTAWLGYRFARLGGKEDRRRVRRLRLRDLAAVCLATHPMHLHGFLRSHGGEISSTLRAAQDDALWLRRRALIREAGDFARLDSAALEPEHGHGKEEFQRHRRELAARLERLASIV